jgi:methylamine dehydrogenase accessory protein MauD
MIGALIVSNILLWIAVVALAGVVLALLRQIGVLYERVAPAGALTGASGPKVGEPAPVMRLVDWNGGVVALGGAEADRRSTLLLFVSPTCPVCKTMLGIAESVLHREGGSLRLVLASDGPRAEHEAFVRQHHLDEYGYLLSAELGVGYQVGKLPYAVLLDADGVIRGKGLVNTREHLESLFEARDRGVASLQEYMGRARGAQR